MRLLVLMLLISGCTALQGGAAAMTIFDRLPCFKTGTIHQVSTFDRGGGNADGSHFYLYEDDGFVVLDETGPGTVYRIWATGNQGLQGRMKMYFDGEEKVNIPLTEFFSGTTDPFLFPLVGNDKVSSGGFYSYYPFPFEKSLIIKFTVVPQYYQITYRLHDTAEGTYMGKEDLSEVYEAWNNPSVDPKPPARKVSVGPFNLLPGKSKELLDVSGPGSIQSLVLSLPEGVPENTSIQMYWDDRLYVNVPLGYLFGASLLMGANPPSFYNYFPMPYGERATILLVNDSDTAIEATATFGIGDRICDSYFMAVHNKERTTEGRDYQLLDINARGHIVGTVLDISQFDDIAILEGDEHIIIDGRDAIQGTGIEDFFNGGWYYNRGAFSLPVHGAPLVTDRILAYRLTLADAIPFERSISFSMEHGGTNNWNGYFESVVFLYAAMKQP